MRSVMSQALKSVPARAWRWARAHPLAPNGRVARIVGTALLAVLAVGAGTAAAVETVNAVPSGAAYRVHDTTVTVPQLDERVRLLGALYGVQAPTDPAQIDRFHRDTAKAVAVSDVLDRAASDQGIVIADKAANDQLTRVIQTSFPGGRDAFVKQLGQVGLSEPAVLSEIKRQLANAQLYDKITKDVPLPTDDEVATAYNDRRAEMATPEKRHLRNIVVASEADAKTVRTKLDQGADFGGTARGSSLDKSTAQQNGELGTVTRDQLEKSYGDAAFGAPPKGVFGPVQTQHGWNVGQVLEVAPSSPLSLDQVRDPLRSRLSDERKSGVWNDWLNGQIADAGVRYADDYRPDDPTSAPTGTP